MARFSLPLVMMVLAVTTMAPLYGEEPSSAAQQQAEAALDRARHHLGEAFKAMQEAGSLLYQDKVPPLREKSFDLLEELMGQAQNMLKDLQKQLPKQLPVPPSQLPPRPDQAPPEGGRDRFI
ncbi:MAG: hypothetical protein HQL55_16970 [Magnetococcales bacterium]|nr:hypothetical protein [Magnetococcales bacterium]